MPKHDKTLRDEAEEAFVDEAIQENIRLGFMTEVSPGQFSLTSAGIEHVKSMLRDLPREDE